jgi:hypothetical protein
MAMRGLLFLRLVLLRLEIVEIVDRDGAHPGDIVLHSLGAWAAAFRAGLAPGDAA